MEKDTQVSDLLSQGPLSKEAAVPDNGTGMRTSQMWYWCPGSQCTDETRADLNMCFPPLGPSTLGGSSQVWEGTVFLAGADTSNHSTGCLQVVDTMCPVVIFELP